MCRSKASAIVGSPAIFGAAFTWGRACSSMACTSPRYLTICSWMVRSLIEAPLSKFGLSLVPRPADNQTRSQRRRDCREGARRASQAGGDRTLPAALHRVQFRLRLEDVSRMRVNRVGVDGRRLEQRWREALEEPSRNDPGADRDRMARVTDADLATRPADT